MSRTKTSSKPNGRAGPQSRVNGHAHASTERGGIPVPRDQAASDDARGASAAMGASSTGAPGADFAACGEVASPSNGALLHAPSEPCAAGKEPPPLPCAEFPLPVNPGDFVEEINPNPNLFIAWERRVTPKSHQFSHPTATN